MKSNPVMLYHQLDSMVKGLEEQGKDPGGYRAWRDRYKEKREVAKEYFAKYDKTTDEELIEAGLKFVISNPRAHSVILPFKTLEEVEKYIGYSGMGLEPAQANILDNYLKYYGFLNCRIGCNECEKACPHNIPVNTIMRYNYYFQNKKQEKEAMQLYAKLSNKNAGLCKECEGYCEEACPFSVSTKDLLSMAHNNLSLYSNNYAW
jgi:predicted aldo/keto reductase-like oxidoreductase